eukprot:4137000-Amphidinium_carterae.1
MRSAADHVTRRISRAYSWWSAKELEGEKAMFTGHRAHDDIAYVSRRQVELARYESALDEGLPEALKGLQYCDCCLDTEKELLGLGLGVASGAKEFFEEDTPSMNAEWADDWSGNWLATSTPEQDELACFYEDETYDIGADSDAEDYVWILATDLQTELDESVIEQQLASFSQVQKQKNEIKKARGWFTPASWPKGGGK